MLTTPITTPQFQSSVQALLSSYYSAPLDETRQSDEIPAPLVPTLKPLDSPLTPHGGISQLLAATSPWLDLASSDPVIADVSRQVFNLEVAYAAFCGIQNIVITGPYLPNGSVCSSGIAQFARAVQEALDTGPYLQVQILLPMLPVKTPANTAQDSWHLSNFAIRSSGATSDDISEQDQWGTWEAWNVIRTFCNYNSRLGLGKIYLQSTLRGALKMFSNHLPSRSRLLLTVSNFDSIINTKTASVFSSAESMVL
jgi:protein arginine N-methyltransferase 5